MVLPDFHNTKRDQVIKTLTRNLIWLQRENESRNSWV